MITKPEEILRSLAESRFESFFSFSVIEDVKLYHAKGGEVILKEGKAPDGFLYYLISGRAKLFSTLSNGKTSLLDFLQGGCFLGELELLRIRKNTLGVQTLSHCKLMALPIEKYRSRLMSDPVFLRELSLALARKEERRVHHLTSTQGFPLPHRLARFILEAAVDGVYTERNTDASNYLGVSYRHLTQVLGDFNGSGYLEKAPRGYKIMNEPALERLAKELDEE